MRGLFEIMRLEWRAAVRSRAFYLLLFASVGWTVLLPYLLQDDGTDAGSRELFVRYALGGVFSLLAVSLATMASGSLARERAARRLALALVRPVTRLGVVMGRVMAWGFVGALVLIVSGLVLMVRVGPGRLCYREFAPQFALTPQAEAERAYEKLQANPAAQKDLLEVPRADVIRLLSRNAMERTRSIAVGTNVVWTFELPRAARVRAAEVKVRFTNLYGLRDEVWGRFSASDWSGDVRELTQAVTKVPLQASESAPPLAGTVKLRFDNTGSKTVTLRPRRDIHLRLAADAFIWNWLRAVLVLTAVLIFIVSFAAFLGATLGRSVATFTALSVLFVVCVSAAVEDYGFESLSAPRSERVGRFIAREAARWAHPAGSFNVIESLSQDTAIEGVGVVRLIALDGVALPVFWMVLAAWALPRKQEEA